MEWDVTEVLVAVLEAAGGTVFVDSESLESSHDKAVAIDYDTQEDRFVVSLIDTSEIDYEENDAV